MRVDVDLNDGERLAVRQYAHRFKYRMDRAYAELIRRALRTRIGIDFTWGVRDDEFMVVIDYGDALAEPTFSLHVPRDRAYLVSAECKSDIEGTPVEYRDLPVLDNAAHGITYPIAEKRLPDVERENLLDETEPDP